LYFVTGRDPKPVGTSHPNIAPYGAFPASDGLVIIACLVEGFWRKLCDCLDRSDLADDPRFATAAARLQNREALDRTIAEITRPRTVAEWVERLSSRDVPHAPILSVGEALSHPHSVARGMVQAVEHPTAGRLNLVGRPIKFPGMQQPGIEPAPTLGQHTRAVLREELGLGDEELGNLAAAGVIDRRDAGR